MPPACRELTESGQELGLAPTKLLLLASESQSRLRKLSLGCTVICMCVCITSFVALRGTRAFPFPSPGGAEHFPSGRGCRVLAGWGPLGVHQTKDNV